MEPTLEKLIHLLDTPDLLVEEIKKLELNEKKSDEIEGFRILYNQFEGNCTEIKNYLKETKSLVLANQKTLNTTQKKYPYFRYAALFLCLIGIGFLLKYKLIQPNYYEKYAPKDKGLPVFMDTEKDNYSNWMLDYKEKKYFHALIEGKKLHSKAPKNDTINYYLGIIYLELDSSKQALLHLEKIKSESNYYEKSEFLKGICYLEVNHREFAKELLEKVAISNSELSVAAKQLIDEEF